MDLICHSTQGEYQHDGRGRFSANDGRNGAVHDIMYKHSARPCDGQDHKGIRHVLVCRALTIVKRFYSAGYGHPDFPFQLVPTHGIRKDWLKEFVSNFCNTNTPSGSTT